MCDDLGIRKDSYKHNKIGVVVTASILLLLAIFITVGGLVMARKRYTMTRYNLCKNHLEYLDELIGHYDDFARTISDEE